MKLLIDVDKVIIINRYIMIKVDFFSVMIIVIIDEHYFIVITMDDVLDNGSNGNTGINEIN